MPNCEKLESHSSGQMFPPSKILRTPLQIHELVVEAELRSLTEVMFMITCRGGGGEDAQNVVPYNWRGGGAGH